MSNNPDSSIPAHVQQIKSALTLIRRKEVERRTALSRSRIYDLMKQGRFPTNISLGKMSVAWVEIEIDEWVACRIADMRG